MAPKALKELIHLQKVANLPLPPPLGFYPLLVQNNHTLLTSYQKTLLLPI